MDGVTLLMEAEAAGLTVLADGDRLRVRGPRCAEHVAKQLLAHKPAVLCALADPERTAIQCVERLSPADGDRVLKAALADLEQIVTVARKPARTEK